MRTHHSRGRPKRRLREPSVSSSIITFTWSSFPAAGGARYPRARPNHDGTIPKSTYAGAASGLASTRRLCLPQGDMLQAARRSCAPLSRSARIEPRSALGRLLPLGDGLFQNRRRRRCTGLARQSFVRAGTLGLPLRWPSSEGASSAFCPWSNSIVAHGWQPGIPLKTRE